jgi:glycosyltransferase involved in cell wall biosynthesis
VLGFRDPGHRGQGLVIVNEQSTFVGGTEQLVAALAERYPEARLVAPRFARQPAQGEPPAWSARATLVDLPGSRDHFRAPVYAWRLRRRLPPLDADVVLVLQASGWGLGVPVRPGVPVVAHTIGPPRWLYHAWRSYLPAHGVVSHPVRAAALPLLRAHDRRLVRRAHRLLATSAYSAAATARVYGRTAEVVHPPVRQAPGGPPPAREHVLTVSRVVPQKRLDRLVDAFRGLERRLVVVGAGPALEALRRAAPPNVTFLGWVDDATLEALYRRSSAFVSPALEEFGIAMAEAQAHGVPVLAPRAGGALEVVQDGRSGLLLGELTPQAIRDGILALEELAPSAEVCRASAARFAPARFLDGIARALDDAVAASASSSASKRSSGCAASTASAAERPATSARSHA